MINIVVGPQGCGKTRNHKRLKEHFKAKRVVDDWSVVGQALEDGDIALTNYIPNAFYTAAGDYSIHQYFDLAKELDLGKKT